MIRSAASAASTTASKIKKRVSAKQEIAQERLGTCRAAPGRGLGVQTTSDRALPCKCKAFPKQFLAWLMQTQAFSFLSTFLVPDWAPGPVQMCRDRRDIGGCMLKVGLGRAFVENVYFFGKFRSPSATYPFFRPWLHEYLFMNVSTRFVVCFSFRTRSSNLFSVSQSLPNHEFFKKRISKN